jgi:hemoglobin-like flavoprotein
MSVTENELSELNSSFERCIGQPRFLQIFYDKFISASPQISEKFADTDMRLQRKMLKSSLYFCLLAVSGDPEAKKHLMELAHAHKARSISADDYDIWLDCLISSVKECDARSTPMVESAWRNVMGVCISEMKAITEQY